MRKCLDCGKALPDVAMKCDECGSESLSFIEAGQSEKKAKNPKTYIIFIIAGILAVLAIIFAINYSSEKVPAKPVKNALIALNGGEIDTFLEEVPERMQTDMQQLILGETGSFEAYKSEVTAQLEENFGENYKISAKLIDTYDFSDELLESLNQACVDSGYNIEFSNAKHITVRLMIESKDKSLKNYSAVESYSVELDGKWYYMPTELLSDEQSDTEQ